MRFYASSEGSDEPAHLRSLARVLTADTHKLAQAKIKASSPNR